MTDLNVGEPAAVAPVRRRSRRRRWIGLGLVVVLLIAGAVVAVEFSFRYLHATPLSSDGGDGWVGPDRAPTRLVSAGPYTAEIIPPRPGHRQTFELELDNLSHVSQTVLGLVDGKTLANPRLTGEPETLQISSSSSFPHPDRPLHFTSKPVTIPPDRSYELRFTQLTARHVWTCGRSEYYTQLALRVRVGIFTRTETLDLSNSIMEIESKKSGC
jgi:hypothetical protein